MSLNTEMKILSAVVAGGAAAAAVGLVRSGYERRHFVVEETAIYSEKIRNPRTLVFLTDLHDKEFGEANGQLLAITNSVLDESRKTMGRCTGNSAGS